MNLFVSEYKLLVTFYVIYSYFKVCINIVISTVLALKLSISIIYRKGMLIIATKDGKLC